MMPRQRWGALSVKDHTDASTLVPEIVLYDHLLIPYPSDDAERLRWKSRPEGWDPDVLDKRLAALGYLADPVRWSDELRLRFAVEFEQRLLAMRNDAEGWTEEAREQLPYHLTRQILADELKALPTVDGVRPWVVPAFASMVDLNTVYRLNADPAAGDQAALRVLLAQRLLLPATQHDPEGVLSATINLAKTADFQQKRRALYDWSDKVFTETPGGPPPLSPEEAVNELLKRIEAFNAAVDAHFEHKHRKWIYTVSGVLVPAAVALSIGLLLGPIAGPIAGAGMNVICKRVEFSMVGGSALPPAADSDPAAMFHDFQQIGSGPANGPGRDLL